MKSSHFIRYCLCLVVMISLGLGFQPRLFAQFEKTAPFFQDTQDKELYTLRVGDRIKITIYPDDEHVKGGETQIGSEGMITLPLIGKIPIAGDTIVNAEKKIAEVLSRDYFVDPGVIIEIMEYEERSVVILGQVKQPGTYEFPPGKTELSLLEAISLAGGFSDIANPSRIKIMRKVEGGSSRVIRANAESIISGKQQDVVLLPGDVIHVTESLF